MKAHFFIFTILFLLPYITSTSQTVTAKTEQYLKALEALQKKDTTSALTLFKESIRQNGDSPSYYKLSKIYWQKKDFVLRNKAFENMKMAVMKDEKNIEYKYFYADVCQDFARVESVNQWKEIAAIDSSQIRAWINLAEFFEREYLEWDKSLRKVITFEGQKDGNIPYFTFSQNYYQNDYWEAVKYFKGALKIDSLNYDLCLKLGLFYSKNNQPLLGIPHLKRLEKIGKADKLIYQCLGLLYYKAKNLKESYLAYQKALKLMSEDGREDFTLNSIKFILSTGDSRLNELRGSELNSYLDSYWRTNDPFVMTDYNERLLEHYSRVAYSNLNFSIPRMNIVGWKSNRGEMVLRYGEPISRIRVRPNLYGGMGQGPDKSNYNGHDTLMSNSIKGETWNYRDFTIQFEDPFQNGNFQFDNSQLVYLGGLRKTKPTTFYPDFEGPVFDLSYQSYQFASKNKTQTDVYLSYVINFSDTSTSKEKFADGYDVGLFMFDNNFNKKYNYKKTYTSLDQFKDFLINSLEMTLSPQSGNLAFEMMRKKDKGVTSYHGKFNVRKFSNDELDISEIVLATNVETGEEINGSIKRKEISVLPNPAKTFGKENELFLYYEIYNLNMNTNNLTDFEQRITIQKKEEGGVLNSILSVVGLDKEGKKVALTSKYQTQEKDPQMYMQLDMSKYQPGEYAIMVTIKDILTGKETTAQTEINWQK